MKTYRRNFTLVELLAAMAVFCVLLLVSMRLFSGSQRLWVRAEQKTNTFADARTAMEFIASRLQTLVYYEDVPFGMCSSNTAEHEIWFASAFPVEDGKSEYYLRFFKFERNPITGALTMKVYSDKDNRRNFPLLFPPYEGNHYCKTAAKALERISEKWKDVDSEEIIDKVTSFKVYGFFAKKKNNGTWKLETVEQNDSVYCSPLSTYDFYSTGDNENEDKSQTKTFYTTPPYLVEVEISLLDSKERYDEWKAADANRKKDLESEYGYTFRRAILLGQRSVDE